MQSLDHTRVDDIGGFHVHVDFEARYQRFHHSRFVQGRLDECQAFDQRLRHLEN
jgi:hypothetical protein